MRVVTFDCTRLSLPAARMHAALGNDGAEDLERIQVDGSHIKNDASR
jgi:hypothetical protein